MSSRKLLKAFWIIAITSVALVLLGTLTIIAAGHRDQIGKADVALVLGSKVELDGTPSSRLRARLDKTLELYQDGYFPTIITSGGVGIEGFDEALVMKDYLVAHGVPSDQVILDSHGTNTFLSAKNTQAILQERHLKSVFVISQYFHLPHSRLALHRFGIGPVYSAAPSFYEARDIYSSIRELFGYINYSLRSFELPNHS